KPHLPIYLRAHRRNVPVPRPGATLGPDDADGDDLADYVGFLKQLLIELDVTNPDAPSAKDLRGLLRGVTLAYPGGGSANAWAHVSAARQALVNRVPASSVQMPLAWPPLSSADEDRFAASMKTILEKRLNSDFAPRRNRFDGPADRYVLLGFVRVK